MTLRATFEAELVRRQLTWCTGPAATGTVIGAGSPRRAPCTWIAAIGTRRTLYRGLHEVAHLVLGHDQRRGRRRWQLEAEAEAWTQQRFAELGIELPQASVDAGRRRTSRGCSGGAIASAWPRQHLVARRSQAVPTLDRQVTARPWLSTPGPVRLKHPSDRSMTVGIFSTLTSFGAGYVAGAMTGPQRSNDFRQPWSNLPTPPR